VQFPGESYVDEEVDVTKDGAEDGEAGEDGHGNEPVATNADIESTCEY
jgi:hypothetical protein